MIKASNISKLYDYLSKILFFGVSYQYSTEYIEESISNSFFINELESSNDRFLYNSNLKDIVEEIYPDANLDGYDFNSINPIFKWVGEAYIRLFFKFHKSMNFIFLYIPLDSMIDLFDLYHQMDWSQLYSLFIEFVKKKTLLRLLLNKRNLSVNKLSQLTNISNSTLTYYCLDNNHLYEAKHNYIYLISRALNVNMKVFLREIFNYTDSSAYGFDKSNPLYRAYLGLYYCSYYYLEIEKRNYQYNDAKGLFESSEGNLIVKWVDHTSPYIYTPSSYNPEIEKVVVEASKNIARKNIESTVLVIFEFNMTSESVKQYLKLQKCGYEKIFIINQEYIMCIYDNYWISYIPDSVTEAMITKAKEKVGGDFAI